MMLGEVPSFSSVGEKDAKVAMSDGFCNPTSKFIYLPASENFNYLFVGDQKELQFSGSSNRSPRCQRTAAMSISSTSYLYSVSAYCAFHSALFTFAPDIPSTDSFGAEEAKKNKPLRIMTSVTGAIFAVIGTTAFCLARGMTGDKALHCGLSVMPIRMAYDHFITKVTPPPPAIALTAGIVGAGLFLPRK